MATITETYDEISLLCEELSGRELHIPDLHPLFAKWPHGVNENLDRLRSFVDKQLASVIHDEKKLKALKGCDFGWFTSLWYPFTEWERLKCVANYCIWLFLWDDELDMADGEPIKDIELERAHRQKTLEFIHWTLGLTQSEEARFEEEILEPPCTQLTKVLFGQFAAELRHSATRETRQCLYDSIEEYVTAIDMEQLSMLERKLQEPDKLMKMRLGTSGSETLTAFIDYATATYIPTWIMRSDAMSRLRHEENVLTLIINDLYSLKKEKDCGALTSMVPVKYQASDHKNLESVVQELVEEMRRSTVAYNIAANDLDVLTSKDASLNRDMHLWLETARTSLTGCLEYHLTTKRYGMKPYLRDDGSVRLHL